MIIMMLSILKMKDETLMYPGIKHAAYLFFHIYHEYLKSVQQQRALRQWRLQHKIYLHP